MGGGERQIPKFDTETQAILKFDRHRHTTILKSTRDTPMKRHTTHVFFYLRQTTPHHSDTKIDNIGYHFFWQAKLALGSILNVFIPPRLFPAGDYGGDLRNRRKSSCPPASFGNDVT